MGIGLAIARVLQDNAMPMRWLCEHNIIACIINGKIQECSVHLSDATIPTVMSYEWTGCSTKLAA